MQVEEGLVLDLLWGLTDTIQSSLVLNNRWHKPLFVGFKASSVVFDILKEEH